MDKPILDATQPIGGDGATVHEDVKIENGVIKAQVGVEIPLDKFLGPFDQAIDKAVDGLEKTGEWTKAILEPLRVSAKAELRVLLGKV